MIIGWSDDWRDANVVATDGGVSNWATIPEDMDLADVGIDYLDGYDLSGLDVPGVVEVRVTRIEADGSPIESATMSRRHDASGRWLK